MIHTIDKKKVEEELIKRGWKRGLYHEWIIPHTATWKDMEEQFTEAMLAGIICEREQSNEETKKFLEKYPTKRR